MNNIDLYEKIKADRFLIQFSEYNQIPKDFVLHWHEHTEILYLREGYLRLRCGESIIDAQQGDCIIINGNELHEGLGGICDFICIQLSPAYFEGQYLLFEHRVRDEEIANIILQMTEVHRENDHAAHLAVKGYAYLLVSCLIRSHSEKAFTETQYRHRVEKNAKINDAVKYIEQNYSERISTAHLAKLSHLSEGHFCHVFKEAMGKSAKDYINSLRVEKAAELLQSTNMTVLEIAMQCGFSDANYFSRMFKKHRHTIPSSLR